MLMFHCLNASALQKETSMYNVVKQVIEDIKTAKLTVHNVSTLYSVLQCLIHSRKQPALVRQRTSPFRRSTNGTKATHSKMQQTILWMYYKVCKIVCQLARFQNT